MKHLIIGSGNMGLKHMRTLQELNQVVSLVDIEFNPDNWNWNNDDSVLICTPAETHADIINKIPPNIPVFCEKPLIVNRKQQIKPRTGPTLMACNWLWCKCIKNSHNLDLFYPSTDQYRDLDYLHFALLPHLKVSIKFTTDLTETTTDGRQIHKNWPCNMFKEQMKHWLRVVEGKEKSRLDFTQAEEYNRKLLKK